jgi:putative endonuclease
MRLKYCVYVLISLKDKNLYVGYTTNLTNRLTAHFKGQSSSTAPRRPFRLIYSEYHHAMSDAKRREQYLKTSPGKAALKRMLRDALDASRRQ